jgi:hemolysin III
MTTYNDFQARAVAAHASRRSEEKPLLRGWSHLIAAVAAAIFTVLLLERAGPGSKWPVAAVFGGSTVLLYTVSALFHRWYWEGRAYELLHTFDHANIFVKIAGAYTPFCLLTLRDGIGPLLMAVIWGLALLGIGGSFLALQLPRWATTGQYLALGWMALLAMPFLAAALPPVALQLLLLAGVLYTVGAAAYALRRPDPLPHIFGFHEVFHAFEVAGTVLVAAVVWFWVL